MVPIRRTAGVTTLFWGVHALAAFSFLASGWRPGLVATAASLGFWTWVLYTGRIELGEAELRWRPRWFARVRSMPVDSIRHVRRKRPTLQSSEGEVERVVLIDDRGRSVSMLTTQDDAVGVNVWISSRVRPVVREKRMAELRDTLAVRFRCPGRRGLAHVAVAVATLAGAALATPLVYAFFRKQAEPILLILGAVFVTVFIAIRGRLAWIGGEIVLSPVGLRIRRVDYDREFAWGRIRNAWVVPAGLRLDIDGRVHAVPEGIEDRDLIVEFIELGRRSAEVTPES